MFLFITLLEILRFWKQETLLKNGKIPFIRSDAFVEQKGSFSPTMTNLNISAKIKQKRLN